MQDSREREVHGCVIHGKWGGRCEKTCFPYGHAVSACKWVLLMFSTSSASGSPAPMVQGVQLDQIVCSQVDTVFRKLTNPCHRLSGDNAPACPGGTKRHMAWHDMLSSASAPGSPLAPRSLVSSHRMYLLIRFRKATLPQNRQLAVFCY